MSREILCEIFKTEERIKILRFISREIIFTGTSVTESAGTSKGHVSKYLRLLCDYGLISKEGRRYLWNENAETIQIKKMLNIDLLWQTVNLPGWAKGVGVYGSVAEGKNTNDSDLDLWILTDAYDGKTEIEAARFERNISEKTGMETHILILTGEKLADIEKRDIPFYENLMKESVVLKGESIERC